jgi:hypothetical protein
MGFFDSIFGGKKSNPANAAMPYIQQIPGQTQQYNQPFFEAGTQSIPHLQEQYGQLLNNPGGKLNDIGQSFQQSPGFQFALQQALQGNNHQQAAAGMAGSPQNEHGNMELATNLGNQEYYRWLDHATNLYGQGLTGEQGMAANGQQAGNNIAQLVAQALAQQGNIAFNGQQQQNQNNRDLFGNIAKIGGAALSAFTPFSGFGSSMFGGG